MGDGVVTVEIEDVQNRVTRMVRVPKSTLYAEKVRRLSTASAETWFIRVGAFAAYVALGIELARAVR